MHYKDNNTLSVDLKERFKEDCFIVVGTMKKNWTTSVYECVRVGMHVCMYVCVCKGDDYTESENEIESDESNRRRLTLLQKQG